MIEIIEKFCQNDELLFGITDNSCLDIARYKANIPFVNFNIYERTNPLLQMENCKSIIVFLMPYKINTYKDNKKPFIASPHLHYDYHKVFVDKLEKLMKLIVEKELVEYKIFVDTGMLMERELAVKAGLGYFSKNTNIINEKFGSSFFIGYIMVDKELDVKTNQVQNNCGSCTICADNCPTGAINGDYTINHHKCLSYITQKKEELSQEEKLFIENNVYGCDVCLKVCPKNKNNLYYKKEEIEFSDFINNTQKTFKEKYAKTGFCWRGNSVIKRNALIGYENSSK